MQVACKLQSPSVHDHHALTLFKVSIFHFKYIYKDRTDHLIGEVDRGIYAIIMTMLTFSRTKIHLKGYITGQSLRAIACRGNILLKASCGLVRFR